MKHYIKNLVLAIRGRNPFAEEVADLKEKLEKAGENVRGLQEQLYAALEKWESAKRLLSLNKERMEKRDNQIASLQTLVENLRERIRDKDAELEEQGRAFRERLEQTRREYDGRIATYAEEIARLKEKKQQQQ